MTENINVAGKDNLAMSSYWDMSNAIVTGADAVRASGEKYLPKFPDESTDNYDFRRKTAKFTNIYRDIIEGLASKPFAQKLAVNDGISDRLEELIDDIDGKGNHLHVFAGNNFFNGVNNAIDWILVEYPNTGKDQKSVAEEKASGARPYWVQINARNILDVRSEKIGGVYQFTYVKILEANDDNDKVRIFKRDGSTVIWELWQQAKDGELKGKWAKIDEGKITIDVIPLVPFVTGRRKGNTWQFFPPMRDAADLQIELYQQEAALKYAKTMACFPMLAGNGVSPATDAEGSPIPVPVGPHAVLYAPQGQDGNHGEWSFIEPSAESLKFLASEIDKTKLDLRELGRQPLTAQSGNLTRITTAVAAEKGNSAVQMWALALKDALELALRYTSMWLGEADKPEVIIHTDFDAGADDDNDLEALLKAREWGDLSQETLLAEFKRRGTLSADFSFEDEVEKLLEEMPGDDDITDKTAAVGLE